MATEICKSGRLSTLTIKQRRIRFGPVPTESGSVKVIEIYTDRLSQNADSTLQNRVSLSRIDLICNTSSKDKAVRDIKISIQT